MITEREDGVWKQPVFESAPLRRNDENEPSINWLFNMENH